VDYIHPALDPVTRGLRVRLRVDNPGGHLKPNMYVRIDIRSPQGEPVLSVPRSALIREAQEDRVILALGGGRYAPRKVRAGMESGDRVQILEGLSAGDSVVTSAQFLIDSEANLEASLQRLQAPAP
jgi:Cu(I)/Ag(I) efflux system membrane fusion protein